jgi:hypothetical protein
MRDTKRAGVIYLRHDPRSRARYNEPHVWA